MKKYKKVIICLLAIFTIIIHQSTYIFSRNKENIYHDIPIIREYLYDIWSLSKVDINNYSINTNFKENYNKKSSENIWKESMTYKHIKATSENKFKHKKTKKIFNETNILLKEIHLLNINFLKDNLIPLEKIETEKSNKELNLYLNNIEESKSKLDEENKLLNAQFRDMLYKYISYLNKYKANLTIEDEISKYNDYFELEYSDLLNKQFDLKLKDVLK